MKYLKENLFINQDGKCHYCGQKFTFEQLTIDHKIPKSKGGILDYENIVLSCSPCNSLKSSEEYSVFSKVFDGYVENWQHRKRVLTVIRRYAGMMDYLNNEYGIEIDDFKKFTKQEPTQGRKRKMSKIGFKFKGLI